MYQPTPEISKLKEELAENNHKLEQAEHRLQRLRNREIYYKKAERAKRAHRLITKGAAIESIVPSLKNMSEMDFYNLMSRILTLPDATCLIKEALSGEGK